ncbi:GxxExxY protein [Arcicella aurantiaca]|uniref:GxxExxY protein n=1 Tax=Arcicella aurantiaca TaxID=591202 RepID=A0A316DXP1_9BACT|nr:GxxExxY protein [Arcicella aurantiaca]PWK22102.1 GxxExxY protein [Arcicella aurantiaca]
MENTDLLHQEVTDEIINAFYFVYNELGYGFLEKVYQNSLYLELMSRGFKVEPQKQIKVFFKGKQVGDYYADMIVNDLVIVELKSSNGLEEQHEAQLLNYLKATVIEVGLLLNFGLKPQIRRKIFTNDRKKSLLKSS